MMMRKGIIFVLLLAFLIGMQGGVTYAQDFAREYTLSRPLQEHLFTISV